MDATKIPAEVLITLMDAAAKWRDELDEYLIPAAEETSDEDAEAYRAESAAIDEALMRARALDSAKEN